MKFMVFIWFIGLSFALSAHVERKIISTAIVAKNLIMRKINLDIMPKNKMGQESGYCFPFSISHRIEVQFNKNCELNGLRLLDRDLFAANISSESNIFRAIYAYDLENGDSVTVEYSGQFSNGLFTGKASVQSSTKSEKCTLSFEFNQPFKGCSPE